MARGKVLVLGGSGFIGEPTVVALRAAGFAVFAPPRRELDLALHPTALAETVASHDTIVVLTQPSVSGIYSLVSALALCEKKHVLYASTSLLYVSSGALQSEDAPLKPITPYEHLKLAEEMLLLSVQGRHAVTIARLGNVYGGPKNKGLVQKALAAMYGGEPLVVSGENQLRDFIHVEDVVEALVHLVRSSLGSTVVNVSTSKGTSIDTLLALLEEVTGRSIPWVRGEEHEHKSVVADNTKLKHSGFEPKVALREGLQKAHEVYARSIQT